MARSTLVRVIYDGEIDFIPETWLIGATRNKSYAEAIEWWFYQKRLEQEAHNA